MININDEVKEVLLNDIELKKLVGDRVYYLKPPAGSPVFPCITFLESSNSEADSYDDEVYSFEIEIQVDIWDKKNTVPVQKEVWRVLNAHRFTHQSMPDNYDPDTGIYNKPIKFRTIREVE